MTAARRDLLIGLALLVALAAAFAVDQPVARMMAGNDAQIVAAARFVSWFGQGGVVLLPTGLLTLAAIAAKRPWPTIAARLDPLIARCAVIFTTVAAAGIVNDVLKVVFGRARPFLWLAGDDSGFGFFRYGAKVASFPSGHTATSVAAAVVFSALFPRWRVAFALFAGLIALSRIIAGAHYPSDVIAGAAVGGFAAVSIVRRPRIRAWIKPNAGLETVPQESAAGAVEAKRG